MWWTSCLRGLILKTQWYRAPCLKIVSMGRRLKTISEVAMTFWQFFPSFFWMPTSEIAPAMNERKHSPTITPQGCSLDLSKLHTEGSLQCLPGNLTPDQAERGVCCSKGLHRDCHRQWMWDSSKTTWKRIKCQQLIYCCHIHMTAQSFMFFLYWRSILYEKNWNDLRRWLNNLATKCQDLLGEPCYKEAVPQEWLVFRAWHQMGDSVLHWGFPLPTCFIQEYVPKHRWLVLCALV